MGASGEAEGCGSMSAPVPAILGIFAVAGLSIIVTGCDDIDDAMRVFEGKPTKAQIAHEQQGVSYYVSPVPSVPVVEVALEERCTVVPAHMFRTHQCDEETGTIIPIR
jgi:hypothetical protein